jgi:hypothetical protein
MTAIDHNLLERLARKAWADSRNPRKAKTWESAHQAVWRAKVLSVCVTSQSGGIGKALVSAIWGEA